MWRHPFVFLLSTFLTVSIQAESHVRSPDEFREMLGQIIVIIIIIICPDTLGFMITSFKNAQGPRVTRPRVRSLLSRRCV